MKKIYCFFVLISLLAILFSCSNETEKVLSPPERGQNPVVFKHNKQEFKIFNYYQEFQDYLNNAKEQPANLDELYKQSIHEALRKNGFGYSQLSDWMFTTPTDLEATAESIDSLINKQNSINNSIKEALIESSELLPGENKTIHVLPAIPEFNAAIKEINYVGGFVWQKDSMLILIDPLFLEEDLKSTVAHEYHHTVYKETNPNVWYTLLENSIVEGKADVFAEMIYPNTDVAWSEPLSDYDNEKVWKIFMENLDSKDSTIIQGFINGNPYYGIPQWSSYKIGKQIMERFLEENPNLPIEEWTKMSESNIFSKSKYDLN